MIDDSDPHVLTAKFNVMMEVETWEIVQAYGHSLQMSKFVTIAGRTYSCLGCFFESLLLFQFNGMFSCENFLKIFLV